ncbi:superoxide dismutase family protein [Paenibacillus sp. YN15]|uniref:superoxide dismutase family protein n=1 Tax=Paenibacillus sp. YN15 TaxID=1742774 RepID=UPI000DCAF257|nr:superoxide dismutase family protein [Paenibacillus sp. YN15]RAU94036.1 superoxide dismutase [Paenibacillus sp. YN15]
MGKQTGVWAAAALLLLAAVSCTNHQLAKEVSADVGAKRVVELIGSSGEKIGQAELTEMSRGVHIKVEASNLVPGKHGFHIHESGKCEPPDFASAGSHFNPMNKQHGFDNPNGPHAGDLPNLFVGTDGTVKAEMVAKHVTLAEGHPNSLIRPGGTSLVIHEKPDDYKTDPSGNSSKRIACGRIQ